MPGSDAEYQRRQITRTKAGYIHRQDGSSPPGLRPVEQPPKCRLSQLQRAVVAQAVEDRYRKGVSIASLYVALTDELTDVKGVLMPFGSFSVFFQRRKKYLTPAVSPQDCERVVAFLESKGGTFTCTTRELAAGVFPESPSRDVTPVVNELCHQGVLTRDRQSKILVKYTVV